MFNQAKELTEHKNIFLLLALTALPLLSTAQVLPICPTLTNVDVDPRRSLMVTEVDVVTRAISLREVMDKLVDDSGDSNLNRRRLWAQWWDTQNTGPGLGLGSHCDDQIDPQGNPTLNGFPLDCPRNEGSEVSSNPFNPNQPGFYYPIALVNRLDLAAEDGSHCGEYRVIFARDPDAGDGRNLLIFEAVLPNPNPDCGIDGCRGIAEFWAGLSRINNPATRARMLHDFYFAGLPAQRVRAVIDARNFAPGAGQIRTNQFMTGPNPRAWQLREFKLALLQTEPQGPGIMRFVPISSKGTPWGELFNERFNNPLTIPFMRHYITQLDELDANNVTQLAYAVPNQYNSGQSTEQQGSESDYPAHFNSGGLFARAIQARLNRLGSTLTPEETVRRARTQSCAGCHQLSNNDVIGDGLVWPPSLGFVHIHEQLTEQINGTDHFRISPALADVFLPHRERIFESYLGSDCQPCRRLLTNGSSNDRQSGSFPILMDDGVTPLSSQLEALDAALKSGWPSDTLGGPAQTH
ncbi:MAG TPA: hypothetical protein QF499_09915 [Gammaproteobacteria bacterium]|nr:hypothetical protein [Gammaproteobacteria bacterium]